MSSMPSPVTPQVSRNRGTNFNQTAAFEEVSVAIADRPDTKTVDYSGGDGKAPVFVSSIRKDEPIVTRRELWSYYRQSSFLSLLSTAVV